MKEKRTVNAVVDGRICKAEAGTKISDLLSLEKPCGGHGRCGKCKVKATGDLSPFTPSEEKLLTEKEKKSGIRLACTTLILGDCEISPLSHKKKKTEIVTEGVMPEHMLSPIFEKYGIAVDIGTTTLASKLYSVDGDVLAGASILNPQGVFGADVISRIEAHLSGKGGELAHLIREAIDSLIRQMANEAGISAYDIDGAVITGNTAMLYLLTDTSPLALSRAPFEADRLFGEFLCASELELTALASDTQVYLAPCIAAFVGADTVCAILATRLCEHSSPALLADIGTNGEMALFSSGKLSVCSTAAGPAFEGGGISMGMRGADGAIDKVSIVNSNLFCHVIGEGEAEGICGSGLVDAVSCLLHTEEIDETGFLEDGDITLSGKVMLTQQDVRMLQLAKSAICAGMLTLIDESGLEAVDISDMYIAGGFGSYLNIKNGIAIGLIPQELDGRINVVGNAALSGASLLLLDSNARNKAESIAKEADAIELSTNKGFSERYMYGMLFGEAE